MIIKLKFKIWILIRETEKNTTDSRLWVIYKIESILTYILLKNQHRNTWFSIYWVSDKILGKMTFFSIDAAPFYSVSYTTATVVFWSMRQLK